MRQPLLAFIAALCALIGLGAVGWYWATLPTTLRIAVGPVSNENVRIVAAAVQTLQRERESFRLKLMLTEGSPESSAALEEGNADLAVVRTDNAYPRNGAAVAVMNVDHVLVVAPPGTGVKSFADLRGKTVALARNNRANQRLFKTLTAQAGLSEEEVKIDTGRLQDIRGALDQGRVQAVFAVGPTSGRLLIDIVNLVTEVGRGEIVFVPVPETSAIEQRHPLIEADTLVRGLFGGVTPRPSEDVPTVTVSHQLLASKNLSDATISDFTRVLLNAKAQIAVEAPLASRMEAPDQEKTSPIPIHPGTITYLDGQTSTFLERYGDWFYIGIMGLGLGGSLVAGWFSFAAKRARERVIALLDELQRLIGVARSAPDAAALAATEASVDAIFSRTLRASADHTVDAGTMAAFNLAFAQARDAIRDRRQALNARS
jgi:TRAP transporter TAXI family solute receptor